VAAQHRSGAVAPGYNGSAAASQLHLPAADVHGQPLSASLPASTRPRRVLNPVEAFLHSVGAEDTWGVLKAEDIVDMETLSDMSLADFRAMSLTLGKISKIRRGLQSGK
jgi:hypothetical protein